MRPGIRAISVTFLCAVVTLQASAAETADKTAWLPVTAGVFRTTGFPCAYVVVDGDAAMLIGAPRSLNPKDVPPGVQRVETLLLTHHHRDSTAAASAFVAAGIPVRASEKAADYLLPEGVAKYWQNAMPVETPGTFPPLFARFWGDWSYLIHPVGIPGIQCDLADQTEITWRGWQIRVVATPGHSRDHVSFVAQRKETKQTKTTIIFCGDALSAPGKIWAPYTTEWHHQKDDGLTAAALSVRRLAALKPSLLCPEHGSPIKKDITAALLETSERLEQAALLKNFVDFTRQQPGELPEYAFLAPKQVGTAVPQGNPLPWTRLSKHLYLTGNLYALVSDEGGNQEETGPGGQDQIVTGPKGRDQKVTGPKGPVLLMDPYSQDVNEHLEQLRKKYGAGPLEVAMISHAHNDHYTGIFALPQRDRFSVWTLDRVAEVVSDPLRFRAPYADARKVRVDRVLKDGDVVKWHEYELTILHQPGQTDFAMGVLVTIDGKKCLFTGDNFYHMEQYAGNGGWSGRNRGLPAGFVASTKKVLELKPDWILAEHGGAFEYHPEDFRRRLLWAETAARVADSLSPSGHHIADWDPHRIHVEPLIQTVTPGGTVIANLVVTNPLTQDESLTISIPGQGFFEDQVLELTVPAGETVVKQWNVPLKATAKPGTHVFAVSAKAGENETNADVFFVLRVGN